MRIVDAAGADVCACCGTHVARAGEVQFAKFTGVTRHKGHTVIEALFGARALTDYFKKHEALMQLSAFLFRPAASGTPARAGRRAAWEQSSLAAARVQQALFEAEAKLCPPCTPAVRFCEGLSPDGARLCLRPGRGLPRGAGVWRQRGRLRLRPGQPYGRYAPAGAALAGALNQQGRRQARTVAGPRRLYARGGGKRGRTHFCGGRAVRPHPPAARRIALLDWVKAAAIVNMVAYHALYDAAFLFGAAGVQAFMRSAPAHWWGEVHLRLLHSCFRRAGAAQPQALPPGAGCVRRGAAYHGCDAGVHTATFHLVRHPALSGPCGASYRAGGARPAARAAVGGPCLRAALFWLTHTIPYAQWPWGAPLPQALYDAKFLLFLGFWPMNSGLTSSDYFPLMPWLFLFWAGLFAGRAVHGTPLAAACARVPRCRAAEWLARHALVIYVVHQPLAAGLVWLILRFA